MNHMIVKKNNRNSKMRLLEYWDPFVENKEIYDKDNIKSIKMNAANENQCRVKMSGKNVIANEDFYSGDIVEIAPCKIMENRYLLEYIKDLVFEIPNGKFAIPFGYVQYYDVNDEEEKSNCDYLYDPNIEVIIIKAIRTINKGEKLVLNSRTIDEA